jgi:hypothetical protein
MVAATPRCSRTARHQPSPRRALCDLDCFPGPLRVSPTERRRHRSVGEPVVGCRQRLLRAPSRGSQWLPATAWPTGLPARWLTPDTFRRCILVCCRRPQVAARTGLDTVGKLAARSALAVTPPGVRRRVGVTRPRCRVVAFDVCKHRETFNAFHNFKQQFQLLRKFFRVNVMNLRNSVSSGQSNVSHGYLAAALCVLAVAVSRDFRVHADWNFDTNGPNFRKESQKIGLRVGISCFTELSGVTVPHFCRHQENRGDLADASTPSRLEPHPRPRALERMGAEAT